jgi:uncharacterized GH25 family protein
MRTLGLVATALFAAAASLAAHDFWLAAAPWHAAPGSRITVTANVGDRFPIPTSYTDPARVASVSLVGPNGATRVEPAFRREGQSLAATVELPSAPATYLVVMVITPRFIEIPPNDFATYLSHEGLERVIAERARRGESARPGRERYSRYAKLLVRAGDGPSGHVTAPLGLPAELVPLADPTRLRRGETLAVRLLADGHPVADALVGAVDAGSSGAPDDWPLKARTDRDGVVRLRLDAPGPWLVRSVHMVRRDGESGSEAVDWESFWASLAFDLGR